MEKAWIQRSLRYGKRKDPKKKLKETYNTRYSLVVTDPTTNPAVSGLTRGERTRARVFHCVWSYVEEFGLLIYIYLYKLIR